MKSQNKIVSWVIEQFSKKVSSETLFLIFILWLIGAQTAHRIRHICEDGRVAGSQQTQNWR